MGPSPALKAEFERGISARADDEDCAAAGFPLLTPPPRVSLTPDADRWVFGERVRMWSMFKESEVP